MLALRGEFARFWQVPSLAPADVAIHRRVPDTFASSGISLLELGFDFLIALPEWHRLVPLRRFAHRFLACHLSAPSSAHQKRDALELPATERRFQEFVALAVTAFVVLGLFVIGTVKHVPNHAALRAVLMLTDVDGLTGHSGIPATPCPCSVG